MDGVQVEDTWRAHQVPLAEVRANKKHLGQLSEWLKSMDLRTFDANGTPVADVVALAPEGDRRMSAIRARTAVSQPCRCDCPTSVTTPSMCRPGATSEATREMGKLMRDIIRMNPSTFRLFGPDETARTGSARSSRRPTRALGDAPRRRASLAGRSGHGGPVRASLPGLAGGLPANRPHGFSTATRRSSTSSI